MAAAGSRYGRALAAVAALAACNVGEAGTPSAPEGDPLAPVRQFERDQRAALDVAALAPAARAFGPDPVAVAAVGGDRFVGLLRGRDALALIGPSGDEFDRAPTPPLPRGLAVDAAGTLYVASELSGVIARYVRDGDRLIAMPPLPLAGTRSLTAIAAGADGALYALADDALVGVRKDGSASRIAPCHGPASLAVRGPLVAAACVLDRRVLVYDAARDAVVATVDHDGPAWSVALVELELGRYALAAGGVEDHPLERRDGGFGYIDSFVFVYLVDREARAAVRDAAIDVSAEGVVMPRWLRATPDGAGGATLEVLGYGGDRAAAIAWHPGGATAITTQPALPGAIARADGLIANPLLDAWITADGGVHRVPDDQLLAPELRLGEALYATTLIAPGMSADGAGSRFTCETCHFEGYGDGRTHYTGRDDVFATTRSIRGVFNNRPHFSRALDRTTTDMIDNEIRVANAGTGRDPWFALDTRAIPLLAAIEGLPATVSPLELRRALMRFFIQFTHDPNPAGAGRQRFTSGEAAGAAQFRALCASCHAARLVADEATTAVPFEDWERLVLSEAAPIVWGSDGYQKTGVEPYVHPNGSRVPSLRRLTRKAPYFTNGSAASLDELLARFRVRGGARYHDRAPADATALTAEQRQALLAFLALL